ncbi:hypothetical protein BCR34DRAFT_590450 [Clohesyomyces aquaticus]|uniref:Fork-head domain-containing protein n=1 Tax=Clohesyomyces aquaticus TaxID=1231657 RepID=A0A1Y1ZAQ3_9PLEO|nr:hypothetical protein BCR34DRAFT_590450 [Clohesyomyces aquaticus]
MPHPQSPHRPFSGDLSGDLVPLLPPNGPFCTPGTLHSQAPLSSVSPTLPKLASAMATTFQEPLRSKDSHVHSSPMNPDDTTVFQWPPHYESMLSHDNGGYRMSPQFSPEATMLVDCPPNGLPYNLNYHLTYSAQNPPSSCPRSYASVLGLPGSMSVGPESYPPGAYLIQKPQEAFDPADRDSSQFQQFQDHFETQSMSVAKVEESTDYPEHSYEHPPGARCATPSDDPPLPPNSSGRSEYSRTPGPDESPVDKEQPYAQLIYRALMEAPEHTMVLRDIYDWFKNNTDKAADKETKGWQNSIRHNLSMNGAFEKVDHPSEEAKKGFMWRLTKEAVREGVKSTTRYRTKQPNKRGHRSTHPQPRRQASGAKGGQAARRAARYRRPQRMNEGYRSDPYGMVTSAPAQMYHCGYDSGSDMSMPCASSPYYTSEADFGDPSIKEEGFGNSPLVRAGFPSLFATHPYSASAPQALIPDASYVLPSDPSESLFYEDSNTSSPPVDEPMTPPSPSEWEMDTPLGHGTYIFDEINPDYREYTG